MDERLVESLNSAASRLLVRSLYLFQHRCCPLSSIADRPACRPVSRNQAAGRLSSSADGAAIMNYRRISATTDTRTLEKGLNYECRKAIAAAVP